MQRTTDENLVLAGLRRNGQLGYKPDMVEQRLLKVEMKEGTWSAGLKEGSHRYPNSFLLDRYTWLDDAGRPIPVDWRRADPANTDVEVKRAPGPLPLKLHFPGPDLQEKGAELEEKKKDRKSTRLNSSH